jgi:hypothetical protein
VSNTGIRWMLDGNAVRADHLDHLAAGPRQQCGIDKATKITLFAFGSARHEA